MKSHHLKFLVIFAVLLGSIAGLLYFLSLKSDIQYVKICEDSECYATGLPYQDITLSAEERTIDLLNRMTIAEKIGQMALIEKNSIRNPIDIAKYGLGGLLSGSGSKPDTNIPQGWIEMVENFQHQSQKTRLRIPLLYGIDANHGNSNVPGATIFPHFIGLGATKNPRLVYEIAKATAEETAAIGIHWIFSPSLDVVEDIRWGRTYESFGSNSETVSTLGKAHIEGLQSYKNGINTIATAKHYIAGGSAIWKSSSNKNFLIDQGNSNIEENKLREIHLVPFKNAVIADVKSVMVGLNSWQGEKISANKYLVNDVLKDELNFDGLVLSDWYGVYEISKNKYDSLVIAVNAGIDMIMLPFDYEGFFGYMQEAVVNGDISQERINEAVRRILKTKFEMGLFDQADATDIKVIGSSKNRELARQAVRESLVALKNDDIIPISRNISKILVAGSAAHNLGKQSGGWTVEWQGIDGNWIPGTTILEGIKNTAPANIKIEYDLNGIFDKEISADVGIAIIGENPYAEGWGDNHNPIISADDIRAIDNLREKSKKIIVIIISGRPLDIKKYQKDWDAIIAAWLPGTEGQGIADVLFGDYRFIGSLPVEWNL